MKGHPLEVTALAAVVRSVFTELAAHGRPARPRAETALATVERWLAGAAVDSSELQRVSLSAHEDGVALAEREQDRALSWANTAAGNLAWMAQKQRGWKDATRSTLDAASYALSSLKVPGVASVAELESRRNEALARASTVESVIKKAPRQSAAGRPRRVGDELLPFIGAIAQARLRANKALFDRSQRATEAQLSAMLLENGYTDHPALHRFEQRYGGLLFADAPGMDGTDWVFGVFACANQERGAATDTTAPDPAAADTTVPAIRSPNDVVYSLDKQGAAWAQDMIEDPRPLPFASNADQLVALVLLQHCMFNWDGVSFAGQRGQQLASQLGVAAIPEASSSQVRAWGSATVLVLERSEVADGWVTRVAAKSKRTLKSVALEP